MNAEKKKRIVVAMSGGVDSSVAAALLAREGHEVIGITLRLWSPSPWNNGEKYGGCCSPADLADAKKVCQQIGIPHYTFDMEDKFREKVVDNFISEYMEGRTPNPCVRCNSFIKFDVLLKHAVAFNADYLATGHYARIAERSHDDGRTTFHLKKAVDFQKDQSYFLYMLDQTHLSRLLFPLGGLNKTEVRALAEEFKLANCKKEDSQDVCFLEGRNYRDFLNEQVEPVHFKKGEIRTKDGKVIGQHEGLPFYTIGQREKLGVATGQRLYVIEKNVENNTLVIGTEDENLSAGAKVHTVTWCAGAAPQNAVNASVKIRYRHPGARSAITALNPTEAKIDFEVPQASVTSGQSAVFYDGEEVLGGGVIE